MGIDDARPGHCVGWVGAFSAELSRQGVATSRQHPGLQQSWPIDFEPESTEGKQTHDEQEGDGVDGG